MKGEHIKAKELLELSRGQQRGALAELALPELKVLATELVSIAKESKDKDGRPLKLGMLGAPSLLANQQSPDQIQQWLITLLNQFPKAANTIIALDQKFELQEDRLNAIISDINNNRLPKHRYDELLHENLYSERDGELKSSRTFIAYALPKLADPGAFLRDLKLQLGHTPFALYMDTPLLLAGKKEIITIEGLYLVKHGNLNEGEYKVLNDKGKNTLRHYLPERKGEKRVEFDKIDTHNISSHKSADESHVAAFKVMLENSPALSGVEVRYSEFHKDGELPRKAEVTRNTALDNFVQKQLAKLQQEINTFIKTDHAILYDKYLRPSDKAPSYETLKGLEKDKADQEIKSLLFQAGAAKRYMDNMINDHKCNSGSYEYDTNAAATCGLTMEEMVASCYWASKDTSRFKENVPKDIDTLLPIIRQLYDMRRGYDIDGGTDKPEENVFPEVLGTDNNRCHGGGVNSLASALSSIHASYNVKTVTAQAMEYEVKRIYEEIVSKNLESIKTIKDQEVLRIWSNAGRITGELRTKLETQFKKDYLGEFEALYKGYIADDILQNIIDRGLDNVAMPEDLKKKWSIEEMAQEDIYAAIANNTLPLLHLDPDAKEVGNRGYNSTLNYLSRLNGKQNLIEYLLDTVIGEDTKPLGTRGYDIIETVLKHNPANQRTLLYLSKSNLSQQYKNKVIHTIEGKEFTLGDISSLTLRELETLADAKSLHDILEKSIELGLSGLFALYAQKVGFKAEDLKARYGYGKSTPMHFAARVGNLDVLEGMLAMPEGEECLSAVDSNMQTPVHEAARTGHCNALEVMLKYPQGKESLNAVDRYGTTPMHEAADANHLDAVREMLKHPQGQKSLLTQGLEGKVRDATPLLYAVRANNAEMVRLMLATSEGRQSMNLDQSGMTPFYFAITHPGRGYLAVVEEMLKTPEGIASVGIVHSSGNTMVHYAVEDSDAEIVKALLTTDAGKGSLLAQNNRYGYTPMHITAKKSNAIHMIAVLLEEADGQRSLSITDQNGNTPLHIAARCWSDKGVEEMLKHPEGRKALNIKNKQGDTPLHIAAKEKQLAMAQAMLATPEGMAAASDRASLEERIDSCLRVFKQFIDRPQGMEQNEAYQYICASLEKNGVDIETYKQAPKKALIEAINRRYPDEPGVDKVELFMAAVSQSLIPQIPQWLPLKKYNTDKEFNPPLYDVKGNTPLHIVIKKPSFDTRNSDIFTTVFGSKEDLDILWLLGANSNLSDSKGRTPLMAAAREGNVEIMKDLILHGADPYMKDKDGKTVTDHMLPKHKDSMTKLLKSYEAMEKQFKNKFENQFVESIKELQKSKQGEDPTVEAIATVFSDTLKEAYQPTSLERIAQNNLATTEIVEGCQLNFIHKFFLRIQSIFSERRYEDLKTIKLADRIYNEIQHTSPFREFIAQTEVGKEAVKSYAANIEAERSAITVQGVGV